ncbi:RDD family protein [Rhodococcus sp. 15-725-2-2b]|uniref:RDD family protein n=1 Tax=Nocardiaceae TaxID=85025 RepID=UPI00050C5679|nr:MULTISPECIES: RDD family protein [Rhodococcus]OZC64279.1 RDD family protein [Rhodococcus sp. 06-470-2]OZC64850.1 RDD family protein [Rhodococcus sp. 06-469-3-2]OZC80125.1 RDD family protein [Rhodococcus sp. 06-418-5]OZD46647.1 RDD family protein [Rhodococcus sp. 06-1477-1A]OZD74977.1 RDD family protein [Rhodococcus sp. 05-339-2]
MARMTGSWLSGPASANPREPQNFRGEELGLPQQGVGALAGTGRRVLALVLDWTMATGVASLVLGGYTTSGLISTIVLAVWFGVGLVSVSLFSFTPGQFIAGIQVARIDAPARVGFVRALVRQLILLFVVPAVVTDMDGRGMHDRATGTALLRTR